MCKYCEKDKEVDQVDLLADDPDLMACISDSISPVAKRRHPEYTGELYIYSDDKVVSVPIKYCPICGRKL